MHGCGPNKDCSKHGACNQDKHTCTCASGYDGVFCAQKKCPVAQTGNGLAQCSEHGACNSGMCVCDCTGKDNCWLGDACEIRSCPGKTSEGIDCSGHGECALDSKGTMKYQCQCEVGYYGDGCTASCPQDCSGHGKCGVESECTCDPGWIGLGCDRTCMGLCQHDGECNLKTGNVQKKLKNENVVNCVTIIVVTIIVVIIVRVIFFTCFFF